MSTSTSSSSEILYSLPPSSSFYFASSAPAPGQGQPVTTNFITQVSTISKSNGQTAPQTIVITRTHKAPLEFSYKTPLTTIFTPPAHCSNRPWVSVNSTQGTITCTRSLAPDCYPKSFQKINNSPDDGPGIYSPGVCPSGYNIGATWTARDDKAGTTICCPPGMSYLQLAGSCSAIISTGAEVFTAGRLTNYQSPFTAFASTLVVAWASSDLPHFSPTSAPFVQAKQAAATSEALSLGAQAGIGVGVGVAGIALLALTIWALLRHRRRKPHEEQSYVDPKAELDGEEAEKKPTILAELGQDRAEVAGVGKPAELHQDIRHELEGDWHGHEAQVVKSPVGNSTSQI